MVVTNAVYLNAGTTSWDPTPANLSYRMNGYIALANVQLKGAFGYGCSNILIKCKMVKKEIERRRLRESLEEKLQRAERAEGLIKKEFNIDKICNASVRMRPDFVLATDILTNSNRMEEQMRVHIQREIDANLADEVEIKRLLSEMKERITHRARLLAEVETLRGCILVVEGTSRLKRAHASDEENVRLLNQLIHLTRRDKHGFNH
ncbi:hypothetical protein Tco_1453607 [Tanacetum coccineum]